MPVFLFIGIYEQKNRHQGGQYGEKVGKEV